jgi:hypothetical protein
MKVHLGPYLKYWGPYQIADLLQYVGVSEERCDKIGVWLAETRLNDICQWIYEKRKRKIEVRIDNYDVWGMDQTLAMIIAPMLRKLKEQKHGTPYTEISDGPVSFSVQKEDESNEDFMWNEDRWNYILDEMIWTFERISCEGEWEEDWRSEEHKRNIEREKNGLRLFGRYYRCLWD